MNEAFNHPRYMLRRKFFKLFGGAFHIYGPDQQLVFYSEMKAFKLKEDIRLYASEDMNQELLTIGARNVIDFSGTYDVHDPVEDEPVGSLRRKGMKSLLKDEWVVLDTQDNEIATIKEDKVILSLLRRFLTNLIPQTFYTETNGQRVATFKQHFNPIIFKLDMDFSENAGQLDPRLGIAAGVILGAIEGRQES